MTTWTDWPARRQPRRAAFAALIIAVGTGAVAALDPWLGFVGALLLLTATAEVLLPTRFEVDDSGVEAANAFRRARRTWDRFGSWHATAEGFQLVGASHRPFLRRRASVELRCPGHTDEIEVLLEQHLGESRA